MPRKSASAKAMVELSPLLPSAGRPEPPRELHPSEAKAWRDIIDALPDHWVDLAGQLILRRLVTQVAIAERKEQRLRRLLRDDSVAADVDIDELTTSHAATAKHISHLLAQLRATPRSRMVPRSVLFEPRHQEPDERPWDVRAGDPVN
jgi:hypothetical protein